MDINLTFCRLLLKSALATLTAEERTDYRKNSGVVDCGSGSTNKYYHFEWLKRDSETGGTYNWEGQADNAYHARAQAINDWVDRHAPKFRNAKPEVARPRFWRVVYANGATAKVDAPDYDKARYKAARMSSKKIRDIVLITGGLDQA